ncbi:MAG: hypothetical protein EOM16_09175, partial [Bacteroidia bacterium]|nr:hypothetical protein [Bacteroidia bacterium]
MKKVNSIAILGLLFIAFFLVSCEKESYNRYQPQIDQMKAVADSIIANTHVSGIVALVVDHNRG